MAEPRAHDRGFFLWALAGCLGVFGFLGIFTIGLPFLLLAALLLVKLSRRGAAWPDTLGLIAGAGLVCLLIAAINGISGDLSPTIWATVGLALLAGSSGSYWWLRCRPAIR